MSNDDPFQSNKTPEEREASNKLFSNQRREDNQQWAKSMGGIRTASKGGNGLFRSHRPRDWTTWHPGSIEEYALVHDERAACVDGLVWLQFGEERRMVSADTLRALADQADKVDSTDPTTWET